MVNEPLALAERLIRDSIAVQEALLESEALSDIVGAAQLITRSLRNGGKLMLFGNGGSAADAAHLAAEFVGRFQRDRRPLPAVSLVENQSALTAIGNDYGFEHVFARQLQGLGTSADVALGISTSGQSSNVLAGLQAAREMGMDSIGLTGGAGAALRASVDVCIVVPGSVTARIQEAHILVSHLLCELTEQGLL